MFARARRAASDLPQRHSTKSRAAACFEISAFHVFHPDDLHPYGINSHRLLVRGRRIETPDKLKHIRNSRCHQDRTDHHSSHHGTALLLVLLLWLLFSNRKRKSTRGEKT